MKITVIGTGYVGLVTGSCLAELGNQVFCLDVDEEKVARLNNKDMPIYEVGLEELVSRNLDAGRLTFSTDLAAAVAFGDIQFIAVGTPPDEDGSADMQYVITVAKNIGRLMSNEKVIVNKSTVPVGTAARVKNVITEELNLRNLPLEFTVVSNPEFLKEGNAINDFMRPDRIVLGCDTDDVGLRAKQVMTNLYAPFNRSHERMVYMDVRSAEFTKYAANAMLATRISFINEMANLADQLDVDIEWVRHGIGSDPRIGYHFLYAGCGYGGSCFPKDIRALIHLGESQQQNMSILRAVEKVNNAQKKILLSKIQSEMGIDLSNITFAIWGLAFKPDTDDMREAASRQIVSDLLKCGAHIRAFDPISIIEAKKAFKKELNSEHFSRITFCNSQNKALLGADALVILTEWKEFRNPDFQAIQECLHQSLIFDGRNMYDPSLLEQFGLKYIAIGRSSNRQH